MGYLITVEGGEYVGKTTVVLPALVDFFNQTGYKTIVSREPGGTPAGERIRAEIFNKLKTRPNALTLAKLFNKARKIHITDVILPTLGVHRENKAIVLLDRYLDSTRVYQGLEGGVNLSALYELERKYVGTFFPDLTLILYFPENIFEKTLTKRMKNDHQTRDYTEWDKSTIQEHLLRQRAYLKLPAIAKKLKEQRQFALIDASGSPKSVARRSVQACKDFLTSFDKL